MLASATFPVRFAFPKPGRYLIGVDFTVRAQTFMQQFVVTVGSPPEERPKADMHLEKEAEGMRVRLALPETLKAGVMQKLTYEFSESDLEPYLSAPMHLTIVKTDLSRVIHTHGELPQNLWDSIFNRRDSNASHIHQYLPDTFGPKIVAYVLFPAPGEYELFGQVRRGGNIVLTRFTVTVQ
jgi:hypothetical protein